MTVYSETNFPIQLDNKPLATPGGEGSVHRVISSKTFPNSCVKIYHQHRRTEVRKNKVKFMIMHKPQNFSTSYFVICWPIELIYDFKKNFIGFIMPLAFSGSEKLYELATTKLSKRLGHSWNKFERTTIIGVEKRLRVCVNIASAVHTIHQTCKYVVVDIKPQNILITIDGKISITDVDSFQISDNNTLLYHSEVRTPEYMPPEAIKLLQGNLIEESWDRFSLAICFYEILFGIHPYTATSNGQYSNIETIEEAIQKGLFVHGSKKRYLTWAPIHNNFTNLPFSISSLFIRTFEDGHTTPSIRPSAEQWGETIFNELEIKTGIKPNNIVIPAQHKVYVQPSPIIPQPPIVPIYPTTTTYTPKPNYSGSSGSKIVWRLFSIIIVLLVLFVVVKLVNFINDSISSSQQNPRTTTTSDTKKPEIENSPPAITVANWIHDLAGQLNDAYNKMTVTFQKSNSNFYEGYGSIRRTYVHFSKVVSSNHNIAQVEVIYDAEDPVNDRKSKNGGCTNCFGRYHSIFILKKVNGEWLINEIKNKASGFSDYRKFLSISSYGIR